MTEADWLTSTAPAAMLDYLSAPAGPLTFSPLTTSRKLRLFVCACVRMVWGLLTDERSRLAVEVAERHADGEPTFLAAAFSEAEHAFLDPGPMRGSFEAELAVRCAGPVEMLTENAGLPCWFSVSTKLARQQADLLRDLFGNPFRPPPAVEPAWRLNACGSLARNIYDLRDWESLPILADYLEDAGCTDAALLRHLRGPGPHARGCWVLDLLTGRQ